ncbi:protein kinase domain-containing protein [Streptomyces wedmorensis]
MGLSESDPRQVGGYVLVDRLGVGGMGTVYLARAESGRSVALKLVHEQFAADAEFRTRFVQEVRAARRVSGAFTAPVVDADPEAARPWMATAYVPGTTLRGRVEAEGPLRGADLRLLAVGLAEALRDMHTVGVIHRDLKPDNVLLTDDGPLVIDFGISRAADHQTMTVTGRMLGTPPFMSPEQVNAPHRVTSASDIFSLGSVLAYASIGRGPFDAGSAYMTAYSVVHEPPRMAELSGTVCEIVRWCLAKDAGERPSPDDLIAAFKTVAEDEWGTCASAAPRATKPATEGPSAPESPSAPEGPSAPTGRRRRRPLLIALAVAVALTAGAAGYGVWGGIGGRGQDPAAGPSADGRSPDGGSRVPDAAVLAADTPYSPTLGGDAGNLDAYADSPERRPKEWRSWVTEKVSGPCVYAAASLVCVTVDERRDERGLVRVDAATGAEIWRVGAAWGGGDPPTVVGDTVALAVSGGIQGFAVEDGRRLWSHTADGSVDKLTVDGSRLYGATFNGRVVAVGAVDGKVLWRRDVGSRGIAYPRVRVADGFVHVLTPEAEGTGDGKRITSLAASDGKVVDTTRLDKECEPWSLRIVPAQGEYRWNHRFLCEISHRTSEGGYLTQSYFDAHGGTTSSMRDAFSLTVSERGWFGVTGGDGASSDFSEIGQLGGAVWRVPLALSCPPGASPAVVTGQRAYVLCGTSGAVVDLVQHRVSHRFALPSPAVTPSDRAATFLVAGGIVYAATAKGWASVDPYASPA